MSVQNKSAQGVAQPARILLLHPDDRYPVPGHAGPWDLVVDFGHAAPATHLEWARQAGCTVLSIFDFSEDVQDLYRTKELLQCGMGGLVDGCGIDWWDVLALMIFQDLMALLMVRRLSAEIGSRSELYMSRPLAGAQALARLLKLPLHNLESRQLSLFRRAQRYFHVATHFNPAQTLQIVEDKFDPTHSVRSRLRKRRPPSDQPVVLLPSAYGNVSRTAIAFAGAFPEHEFVLVYARDVARLDSVPGNVQEISLDPYFTATPHSELASLQERWSVLKRQMISQRSEFDAADALGLLDRISALLPWGLAMRDAWTNFFDAENVTACMSADDTNPYTRVPLILAQKRGIPALACHHGALDYAAAIKKCHADVVLAKSEMERNYLAEVCRLNPEVIGQAPFPWPAISPRVELPASEKNWLVFFSEYSTSPWRGDEMYHDLLPALASLANDSGLQLVIKIHPFENRKDYEQWVRRYLPERLGQTVQIITGAPTAELWSKTRFAVAIQSTTAIECHQQGIPVFLCQWLREPNLGYQEQFARFGIGRILQSVDQLAEIPRILESWKLEPPKTSSEKVRATSPRDLLQPRVVSQF